MGAFSTKGNDDPLYSSRAFDKDRGGFACASGGGVIFFGRIRARQGS